MKELKLLLLEKGDSQKNLVDKTNFNFSQILSFEGGPYGKLGPEGKSGNPGSQGPTGSFGPQGKRGNIWTVSNDSPSDPLNGDYWMNPSSNNEIRVYNSSTEVWDLYSLNINGLDIFREFGPLQTQSGVSSKNGYFLSLQYPYLNTFVLSDSYLTNGSITANPQYTKMVISTNSQIPERRILEFTKGPYHGTSFNQETPYFYWTTGPTSSNGNYGLGFLCPQSIDFNVDGDLNLKSLSGSILFKSGDPSGFGMYTYLSGLYSASSLFGNLNITIGSSYGDSLIFETQNINFQVTGLNKIETSTRLDIRTTGSTGSQPSLNLISGNPGVGNLYYKMDEVYPSTRSGSTLFKATNSTTGILEISGKGDFKVDKIMYPLHPLESPSPFMPSSVKYLIFNPTVSLNGQTDASSFNVSRGVDYYITPPALSGNGNAILLWTPSDVNADKGWTDLIKNNEYMNFRVHSDSNSNGFRLVGINTSSTKLAQPIGTGNGIIASVGQYCTSVEFTIINISKTSTGTSTTNRWFKVLYHAWGGTLDVPVCGELYTNGSTP